MMLVTCRCGAALMPSAPSCGRCGARPLGPAPLVGAPRPAMAMTTSGAMPAPMRTATRRAPMPPAPMPPVPMPMPRPAPPVTRQAPVTPFEAPPLPVAPAHRSGPSALAVGLIAGLTVLALALAGGVAYLLLRPAPPAPAPVVVTAPAAPTIPTGTTTGSGSTDTEESSAALLDEGVTRDRSSVEALTGSWVPQLSAKKVGTVADGRTYDSTDILSHYRELRAQVPGAALLWSGDWPVFTEDDYWVVVAPPSFATPAAANAWCDAQGFGADDCMAKRLAHSGGPSGSTVPRS